MLPKSKALAALALSAFACSPALHAADAALDAFTAKQLPELLSTYKQLHQAPELSHYEVKTSAFLAEELRKAGYTVTENIGKYEDGSQAHGLIGILKNGAGPTIAIRADMDGLPVKEDTGLPYASTVTTKKPDGTEVPVMHACGHDVHITVLLGTARAMAALKDQWHGTLILIGQPSEETIDGARAMMADNLYPRFGKPDYLIAEHDTSALASGTIGIKGGPLLASSTSIYVTMHGVGGHGSAPEVTKDPVLMASEFVVLLQSVVARQISPQQPGVITVGYIHGGTKNNIIPDDVELGITMRAYDEATRLKMIEGLKNAARGVAVAYGIPEDHMPTVNISKTEITSATINDAPLADKLKGIASAEIGSGNVIAVPAIMGSEDFGNFNMNAAIPSVMWWLGVADPVKLEEAYKQGKSLPAMHSNHFAPVPDPALSTGVRAMSAMAIGLFNKK